MTDKAGDDTNYNFVEHPIAGLSIKDDGKMYVSLATNLSGMYSYEREALNYVPYYGSLGETLMCNNAQFKKCANAKEMIDMTHLIGDDHEYETVKVDPTCLRKGFSEERCKVCGRIKERTCKVTDDKVDHHYIYDSQVKNIVVHSAIRWFLMRWNITIRSRNLYGVMIRKVVKLLLFVHRVEI